MTGSQSSKTAARISLSNCLPGRETGRQKRSRLFEKSRTPSLATIRSSLLLLTGTVILFMVAGCKTTDTSTEKDQPPEETAYVWRGFPEPAPTRRDSKILIEKFAPKRIDQGTVFSYNLKITNNATYPISGVQLQESKTDAIQIQNTTPPVSSENNQRYAWNLKTLHPGASKNIQIKAKARETGTVRLSSATTLTFGLSEPVGEASVKVIQPRLDLNVDIPEKFVMGSSVPVTFSFSNQGSASLKNVQLVHTLPKGLLTAQGKSTINIDAGDLAPKESTSSEIRLQAEKKGKYEISFTAAAEGNFQAKDTIQTRVTKPHLQISGDAPDKRYVGDIIPYKLSVKNTGDAPARDVNVKLELPERTSLVQANQDGESKNNNVLWKLDSVHPGQTKTLTARVLPEKIMTVRAVGTARAPLDDSNPRTVMNTDVGGVSALLCNLKDVKDPVPVGNTTTYELRVTNQGTVPATMLRVTATLDDGMEFVTSSGATKSTVKGKDNRIVQFEKLPSLESKNTATWRIEVKAKEEGDVRFKIEVDNEQIGSPVQQVEGTTFYE